jgi:hypothetical protein
MKYPLLITLLILSKFSLAQVPSKSGAPERELRGDISMAIPEPDQKTTGYYQQNGKYGFVTPEDVRQPALYSKIDFGRNGFIVQKDGLYGLADKKGQVIGSIEYDSVGTVNETIYIVKKKGKYGTLTTAGNKVLSIKYDKVLYAGSSFSFVQKGNDPIQLIFNEQEKPYASSIERAFIYSNLAIIKANGKFGVVKNQLVIPVNYDSIFVASRQINTIGSRPNPALKKYVQLDKSGSFENISVLTLQNGNQYGLSDSDGTLIFPVNNDAVYNQDMYKYYTAKKGNLYGIYFISGKQKTGIEFDKVYADGIGYVMANKNQKGGVFNLQGKQIVPFEYDPEFIMQLDMGFAVKKNKKKGIVAKDGRVLVPAIYDDVDTFHENGLTNLIKVRNGEKSGIVNLKGETIIPVEFEFIGEEKGLLKVVTPDRKLGLYSTTGKVVIPAKYQWITNSDSEESNVIILKRDAGSYNFLNKNTKVMLLKEEVSAYGFVPDQYNLLNPLSSNGKHLLVLKSKTGKQGLLNEITGTLNVPLVYDEIIQHYEAGKHTYYSVRKGKKFGLIDEMNHPVISLQYDAINLDFTSGAVNELVVAKGSKYGTVNLLNKTVIPFQYAALQCLSVSGLYKAKTGNAYRIINSRNQVISQGPFDEVANFENGRALTFYKDKMRVVNDKGAFITEEVPMQPHNGYKTFDQLKFALIRALDAKDDAPLKDFVDKVAPSEHLLYYLQENLFSHQSLKRTNINAVKEKYYTDLAEFKSTKWNQNSAYSYKRNYLTDVQDYTLYQQGVVTNARTTDWAFGDNRLMERLLRNAVKVNGYWISSYFMQRNFDR